MPEDAEIGTDGDGLALLAILGPNIQLLEVGRIPNADELYAEAINQAMRERLRRIDAAGGDRRNNSYISRLYIGHSQSLLYRRQYRVYIQEQRTGGNGLSQNSQMSYTIPRFLIALNVRTRNKHDI